MTDAAGPPGVESSRHEVRPVLGELVSTPVRVLQVLGMTSLAITFWMFLPMRAFAYLLPGGDVEGTLANLTAGGIGQRWHTFYVAVLAWGHVPVLFLLLLVGTALTVHSLVHTWRGPIDALGLVPEGTDPDQYVPLSFMFWAWLVIGTLAFGASGLAPLTDLALFWNHEHGITQWVALGWWALAVLAAVGAVAGVLRRRHVRKGYEGTPEARKAARERAAYLEGQLTFPQAASVQRQGHGALLSDAERERIGAGASRAMIVTMFSGVFGLGPVGLIAGLSARRGQLRSAWIGTLGMVLSAVHTTVLVLALVLALATG